MKKENNKLFIIGYRVGNTYREKTIKADTIEAARKKAKVKDIVYLNIEEYRVKDEYLLRDF